MKKVLILYSGGADSRLMVELVIEANMNPYCLLINYGQSHIKELEVAMKQLTKRGVDFQVVKISGLDLNSGLTGGDMGRFGPENEVSRFHVPGRNTMFAGIALSVAENVGADCVWLGADFSDRLNQFPDCFQDYVVKVDEMYEQATIRTRRVIFEAPLLGMSKELILKILSQKGISEEDLFSGYGSIS